MARDSPPRDPPAWPAPTGLQEEPVTALRQPVLGFPLQPPGPVRGTSGLPRRTPQLRFSEAASWCGSLVSGGSPKPPSPLGTTLSSLADAPPQGDALSRGGCLAPIASACPMFSSDPSPLQALPESQSGSPALSSPAPLGTLFPLSPAQPGSSRTDRCPAPLGRQDLRGRQVG